MALGIDASSYQGNIDWPLAAKSIGFAFIRSNAGLYVDTMFRENWAGAKAAGVKRGAYLYLYQNVNAGDQAKLMVDAVGNDWGELPPVVDVENGSSVWTPAQIDGLKWCLKIIEAISGKVPIIYTRKTFWEPYLGLQPWAAHYGLWTAYWSYDPAVAPAIPAPWTKYDYYQYSNQGRIPGIPAIVDLDVDAQGAPPLPPPVTYPPIKFTASSISVIAGEPVTLMWSVEGIEGIWLDGVGVAGVASAIKYPTQNTTYTLLVKHRDMTTETRKITVAVMPAPPAPSTKTRIGLNLIGGNRDIAERWYAAGCRRFHYVFAPDAACQFKAAHPDCDVSHRALFYGGHLPSMQEFQDKHGYCLDPQNKVRVFGLNENNQIGDGGQDGSAPNEIRQRAEWDAQMWAFCKSKGITFTGGGYAMGTPNIVVPQIRQAMRDLYAPLFNAGMRFNQHCYSGNDGSGTPIKTRIYAVNENVVTWDGISAKTRQTWWLEERMRWYVAFCGFDGSKGIFESDETGVDNPGPFNDFGFTDTEKTNWGIEFVRRNSEPMPDGKAYRVASATLFADGDYVTWGAFARSINPPSLWKPVF